jgi:hypothetical protein
MAAHEEQDKRVVLFAGLASGLGHPRVIVGLLDGHRVFPAPTRRLAAHEIDQAARRDPDEPGAGMIGHTGTRPLGRRRDQRLLNRVLGGVEVPEATQERGEHVRSEIA